MSEEERRSYIKALICEINTYREEPKISAETIFFGGGTPSLLEPSEFLEIHRALENVFELSALSEFTVEINPATLTFEKMLAYKEAGVNRISIGMQSIHKNETKILGRIHDYDDFLEAYNIVRTAGIDNVNVDVMYGIPEQSVNSFIKTLNALIALDVPHISVYGLMLEEGTPFYEMRDKLPLPGEESEEEMYYSAARLLKSCGYSHYEISNYAKCGYEARHNLLYWREREYIGLGISAHSFFRGLRYGNSDKPEEYLSDDFKRFRTVEKIGKDEEAYEYAMLALRLKEGISLTDYKRRFLRDFTEGKDELIEKYEKLGLLIKDDFHIALTEHGFYLSNTILSELL